MSVDKGKDTLRWLQANGGHVHESSELRIDPTFGLSVVSTASIDSDAQLISCPFSLAITSELATAAICAVHGVKLEDLVWPAGTSKEGEKWNDRMRVGAYIALHWVKMEDEGIALSSLPKEFAHWQYIQSLPTDTELRTPLYFNKSERELLKGTNLYGAVEDRRAEWKAESAAVREVLQLEGLTWERYLRASTYLSSRAFPSKLLSLPSSGSTRTTAVQTAEEEESHPALLPGIDLFNHARGQPIVWLSSELQPSSSVNRIPSVSLVSTTDTPSGVQLFNNYGPKPNEELLLAYGFTLPDNPDDVVALKLGTSSIQPETKKILDSLKLQADKRFLLRRDGKLDPDLLSVLRILISPSSVAEAGEEIDPEDEHALHAQEEKGMQLELDVLGTLGQMLDDKLAKLEEVEETDEGQVREDVRATCGMYRQGQVDILNKALEVIGERIERLEGMLDQGMGGCSCCL